MPDLRKLRDSMDKVSSRLVASNLAIPVLLDAINVKRDPQWAEQTMRTILGNLDLALSTMRIPADLNLETYMNASASSSCRY